MQVRMKKLLLLTMIIPSISSAMFLKQLVRSNIHNPRHSTYTYRSLRRQLKLGKADYIIIGHMEARNKKLQEKMTAQNSLIAEFKKDPDADKWWRSRDYYGEKLYWLEKNVRMISAEKY